MKSKITCIKEGEAYEILFCAEVAPVFGLDARIHPDKYLDRGKYAVDLLVNGQPADLKCKMGPLFKARENLGLDPLYTAGVCCTKHRNYVRDYPGMSYYFWLKWPEQTGRGIHVGAINAVFVGTLEEVTKACEKTFRSPVRRSDPDYRGTDTHVWYLDVSQFKRLKPVEGQLSFYLDVPIKEYPWEQSMF